MDTKQLDEIEKDMKHLIYGYCAVKELIEQARRVIRIRAYFLRQPKEVWVHYKAALEYKP